MWDVSLNDTGEQFKSLAWDFSNWDLRVYSRELEGLQEYFFCIIFVILMTNLKKKYLISYKEAYLKWQFAIE